LNPDNPPGDFCTNGVCPDGPNTVYDTGGHFELAGYDIISNAASMRPQQPLLTLPFTKAEIDALRKAMEETLEHPGCRDFINAVLKQVSGDTEVELFSVDIMTNFEQIKTFEYASMTNAGGYAMGSIGAGNAKIQRDFRNPILNVGFAWVLGIFGLHETAHLSTGRAGLKYSDRDLSVPAYSVALAQKTEKNVPLPPRNAMDVNPNSQYWDSRIFYACRPASQRQP
jgi:hypothetical protein